MGRESIKMIYGRICILDFRLPHSVPVFYFYFMSYIKRDYFKRKFLNTTPTWEEYMQEAVDNGLTAADVEEFHAMVGTPVDIEL